MDNYHLYIVFLLFALAITDLIIGVSNDAVNFLNSSLGSRVARRNTIMIIASSGILLGAISSGGMMEIAQKGIFRPEMFYFDEIMIVFIAVMFTDIILLDFFNTLGLPTSTTVSIVFELMGAAAALALYKIASNNDHILQLQEYINVENALFIISGIFISIIVAFSIGLIVQYFSRIVFTFHYESKTKIIAPIFGAIAFTAITYFLIVKGLKGSSLISEDLQEWIKINTFYLIVINLLFWTVISFLFSALKINILKIVVLTGTFSLAMAFAGNDLVNFVGVAIGGLTSYNAFAESGVTPDLFNMAVLNNPVQSNTLILLLSGVVMVLTLWFSKKAKTVTDTEINLGRQGVGSERFKPNTLSRNLVRSSIIMGSFLEKILPKSVKSGIHARFYPKQNEIDPPAFDLVRASVNLVVASILIALATSFKMPLSTTYVSFMVAMGTSLADKAWDRDSAVYRVSGVIHVIGGWLFTALIAFSVSAVFAFIILKTEIWGIIFLAIVTIIILYKNTVSHKKKLQSEKTKERPLFLLRNPNEELLFKESKNEIQFSINLVRKTYKQSIKGILEESRKNLRRAKVKSDEIQELSDDLNRAFLYHLRTCKNKEAIHMQYFISVIGQVQHLSQITDQISNLILEYVENNHSPLKDIQKKGFIELEDTIKESYKKLDQAIEHNNLYELEKTLNLFKKNIADIQKQIIKVFESSASFNTSPKLNYLIVNVYIRTIDMINSSMHLTEYYHEFLSAKENIYQDDASTSLK